jgi:hypothetical protein
MNDILSAIVAIDPSAQVSIRDGDLDQITWHNDAPVIPKADIVAMMAELQADYDSKQYQRDRKVEYDKLNQFELIGEDSINGTTNHRDAILAIKEKYPKE